MTIEDLKVGSRVMLGKYGVGNNLYPIWWLKATTNGDFIAECVLDYLMFDAKEQNSPTYENRRTGNPDYALSNIRQFLNSEDGDWYTPSHAYDTYPRTRGGSVAAYGTPAGTYYNHAGFLANFDDHEIDAINGVVELPTVDDVNKYGVNCFKLFTRKGVRPHPTEDLAWHGPNVGFDETSFSDFWLQNRNGDMVKIMDRTGNISSRYPALAGGLRPKCKIKNELEVEAYANAEGFVLKPYEVQAVGVATDEELFALLGLR